MSTRLRFILRRVATGAAQLVALVLIVFFLIRLLPADPARTPGRPQRDAGGTRRRAPQPRPRPAFADPTRHLSRPCRAARPARGQSWHRLDQRRAGHLGNPPDPADHRRADHPQLHRRLPRRLPDRHALRDAPPAASPIAPASCSRCSRDRNRNSGGVCCSSTSFSTCWAWHRRRSDASIRWATRRRW